MPPILISTTRFAEHQTPPGHPEQPARAEVMDVVAARWRERGAEVVAPRAATREQLARVHDERYLDAIEALAGRAAALDPDTYTSPETVEIARLAAGAAIDAVERVLQDEADTSIALVRPPGHHAEAARAMGFCLFNNVAVAAAHARALGVERVAVVDFDVHHGNGTQHIFEHDPDVLYVSLHQYPFYPGTGAASEVGVGDGRGRTANIPIEVGAVDEDYRLAFESVVTPLVEQFAPGLLLVSAGFDAHARDPLAGMRLSTGAFAAMTAELKRLAGSICGGRLALVTEGGYDLHAFAACLDAAVQALADEPARPEWPSSGVASERGRRAVEASRRALAQYWKL